MFRRLLPTLILVLTVTLAAAGAGRLAAAAVQAQDEPDPALLESGRRLYEENCQPCHGDQGKGDGPSARFLETKPRDLTAGYWMYVEDGSLESMRGIVAEGVEGTDMEPFDEILTAEEIEAIAVFVVETIVPEPTDS